MSVYERDLPKGFTLDESVDQDIYFSEHYRHWTVRDVIEQLLHMDMDARVWIGPDKWPETGDVNLRPLEALLGSDGEVIL